jgi:tetratricopeptide (TPR) repeat protein
VLYLRRLWLTGLVGLLILPVAVAQQQSKVVLEPSETIFTVVTAMNACGYDDGLASSDPVRQEVRTAVDQAIGQSPDAGAAVREMCSFYRDHRPKDPSRDLSQYISLALNLGPAPDFKPRIAEADLPPDASYVLGFVPLISQFYKAVNLHAIWSSVQPKYEQIMVQVHDSLANMILATDVYLKDPIQGASARHLLIYVEPMIAPGQVNARNYGDHYFVVVSPSGGTLPLEQIRHSYLHFTLDSLAMKRPAAMKKLEPILVELQNAPLDDVYKRDASLLVTESLIRAIEARMIPGKNAEPKRQAEVARDVAEGFVLTRYFYDSLVKFEPEAVSLRNSFPDWLYYMDIGREKKLAAETQFAARAASEIVQSKPAPQPESQLDIAQQKISAGDLAGAQKIALQVARENTADSPHAYMLLGQIATLNRDKDNAIKYFETTLQTAKDPRLIAWAHIYLGRIYDVDQERDMAVKHYQAALRAGDNSPQLKAAAERGLKSAYERRGSSDPDEQ